MGLGLLLFVVGLFLLTVGVGGCLAFGLGMYTAEYFGYGTATGEAAGAAVLAVYGVAATALNAGFVRAEYRGNVSDLHRFKGLYAYPESIVAGSNRLSSDTLERWDEQPPAPAATRLSVAAGVGLPVLVLGAFSVSRNPYLVFLVPVAAFGVLYAVHRSGVRPVRPFSYHVGLSLALTVSAPPLAVALLVGAFRAVLLALPDLFPHTVVFHLSYSPLHLVLVPLALLPVVFVSSYCLLVAFDAHRAKRGVLPAAEPGDPGDGGTSTGSPGPLLIAFSVFYVALIVNAVEQLSLAASAVAVLVVLLPVLLLTMLLGPDVLDLLDAGSVVAGTVGALVASAGVYATPLVGRAPVPARPVAWLPAAALVGFVTGVLLYAAVEWGSRATARSG